MLFNSIRFQVFFPTVVIVYYALPQKWKKSFLLVVSYVFYMSWNAKYALLILLSTIITYESGIMIDRVRNRNAHTSRKIMKWFLTGNLVLNLSILFLFKYFNFSVKLLSDILGLFGYNPNWVGFNIILPVGISFYTFQALGYSIDVYRGDTPVEKSFLTYALFVSFFPQLVAGPIERSGNLLKQLKRNARFDFNHFCDGVLLMIWGYFLKIVIADRVALFVDTVYAEPEIYTGAFLILGTVLFAFQLYCDFAGYSTIAMGAAEILGISLMDNFRGPYLSTSIAELWRNWHISLTSWFRDYLYIPLGGNRKGRTIKHRNIMIVFLLSGLWHGANLTFVIWGALNGLYQIVGDVLKPFRLKWLKAMRLTEGVGLHVVVARLITFALFCFALVFFRASSVQEAILVIKNSLTVNPEVIIDGSIFQCGIDIPNFILVLISVIMLLVVDGCKRKGIMIRKRILALKPWQSVIIVGLSYYLVLLFGCWGPEFNEAGFIYFQF